MKYCQNCNTQHPDSTQFCPQCGNQLSYVQQTPPPYGSPYQGGYSYGNDAFSPAGPEGKSRGVAGLLAIFIGSLGVHYFYLGKVGGGLLTILLTLVTCGIWGIVPFIQGILMLCMTNEEFERKYVQNPSTFPLF
ncbi:MAG: NINE protein [Bacteroides sp.]|nr:NINE protein [Bacteroides sp.]MCM1379792.1 NINE protein [Bacteroides sp.]MCM1446151.1 NINE protein [Prevotella sp.]